MNIEQYLGKELNADPERLYFESPQLAPAGAQAKIAHSHHFRYRGHEVFVHLTGYVAEPAPPVWVVATEVLRGPRLAIPLQRDLRRAYDHFDAACSAGGALGRQLVERLEREQRNET